MFVVGLTGGISTGKSTVSELFKARGIPVIDADLIAREVVEPGKPAYAKLRTEFGSSFFDDENGGILLRKKLGEAIFSDAQKRRRLNAITHPAIRQEMLRQLLGIFFAGHKFCVLDTPLLFEVGYDKLLGTTIVVWCTPEQQLARLISRDKSSEQEAQERIDSQMSLEEKKARASILIDNTGDFGLLERRVNEVIDQLQSRWTPYVVRMALAIAIGLITVVVCRCIGLC